MNCKTCNTPVSHNSRLGFCPKCCPRQKPNKLTLEEKERKILQQKDYKADYYRKNYEKIRNKQKNYIYDKDKAKQAQFKYLYGIGVEDYNQKKIEQDHRCMICNTQFLDSEYRLLYVDHDHNTGKVRDLLCRKCNAGLGHFNDNPELLQTALDYLKRWKI